MMVISCVIALFFMIINGIMSSNVIKRCNASIPICFIDDPRAGDMIIAGNNIMELIVNCIDCKYDSSSNKKLQIISYAVKTVINAADKDACHGCSVNIGVTPNDIENDSSLSIPDGISLSGVIDCGYESSCKDIEINVDGNVALSINANGKNALEKADILCGDNSMQSSCDITCNNEFNDVCKEYTCQPLINCKCTSIGNGDMFACPTGM